MECPRCSSNQVERLPPSRISPKPGYRCSNCDLKMRSPGMLLVYLILFLLGLAAFAFGIAAKLAEGKETIVAFKAGWIGLFVAGYSLLQLIRPAPRRTPKTEEPE